MVWLSLHNRFSDLFRVFKLILPNGALSESNRSLGSLDLSAESFNRAESFNLKIDKTVPDLQNFQW